MQYMNMLQFFSESITQHAARRSFLIHHHNLFSKHTLFIYSEKEIEIVHYNKIDFHTHGILVIYN